MAKASETNSQNQSEIGEPYFCEECKRNHTKGKIYKEHLNFAKIEVKDDGVADDIVVDDEIEIPDLVAKDDSTSVEEKVLDEEFEEDDLDDFDEELENFC